MNEDFFWTLLKMGISQPVMWVFQGCIYVLTTSDIFWNDFTLFRTCRLNWSPIGRYAPKRKLDVTHTAADAWQFLKVFSRISSVVLRLEGSRKNRDLIFILVAFWDFFTEILFEVSLLFTNVSYLTPSEFGNGKLTVLSEPLWRWVSFEQWKRPSCLGYLGLYGPDI